jgi:hypothetical protein
VSATTSAGTQVLAERAALPHTGADVTRSAGLSLALLTLGGLLLRASGMRLRQVRKH